MFADLLQHRLQATVGPARLRDLHIRASQWYEQNGHVREAVHHAFSAGDLTRAANLIEQNARGMFARSELGTIMDWVDALPKDVVGIRPWCCVYYAWALRLTGGQAEAVEARLRVAELALEKSQEALSKDEARAVLGHIAAIRAYQALYREEIQRVIDLSRQALDSLPEASFARGLTALALGWASRFNGDLARASRAFVEARRASLVAENTYVAVTATCRLAYTKMLGGQLRQATRSCQEALLLATGTRRRRLPVAGYALVYQGGVYREWNNLDKAKSCLKDGIDLCAQVGYVLDQVVGCTTLARVYQAQQDWDSAHEALQSAEQLSLRMKGYVFARRWVEDCQVRLWSAQDRFSEIARWTQETDLRVDDTITFERELEHIILARALVTLGREQGGEAHLEGALNLLARLLDKARSAGWMSKAIEILVLQALANQVRGHTDKALTALGRALSHAEPQGYVRTFVDEGPPMGRLLAEAIDHGIAPGYARSLLVAFGEVTTDREPRRQDEASASVVHPSAVLVETLSKRELEVLGLIAQGLTNQEIADRLCLALSTVKVHTRNIYGKLGVHNRTQAVAKAQSLDLM
jgi:LuxR family maltose regulon positive regulatory protein